jgi:hypothetical protein
VRFRQYTSGKTNPDGRMHRVSCSVLVCTVTIVAGFLLSACVSPDQGGATVPNDIASGNETADSAERSTEEGGQMQIAGIWDGSLKVPGAEIQITVKFLTDPTVADGRPAVAATMDIPTQMAYELPLSNVHASGISPGATVHFELATSGPTLIADGEIAADLTIFGEFTQGAA